MKEASITLSGKDERLAKRSCKRELVKEAVKQMPKNHNKKVEEG